jgi:hypothetical protein
MPPVLNNLTFYVARAPENDAGTFMASIQDETDESDPLAMEEPPKPETVAKPKPVAASKPEKTPTVLKPQPRRQCVGKAVKRYGFNE